MITILKDWQEWTDPIDDFLVPAIQNATTHHPLLAIMGGAFIGAAFGSLKPTDLGGEGVKGMGRYGKLVGGILGASVMSASVLNKMLEETVTGEAWVPERRKKERATEEYFDILKYIKYNALFERYAKQAQKEGFDVKEYITENKDDARLREQEVEDLQELKRQLYLAKPDRIYGILEQLEEQFGIHAKNKDEAMKAINKRMNEAGGHRELQKLTPSAARALLYHQASKQTMYGYESGDPIANVLAALPKKDRDYLVPFIQAPEEERGRILDIVPNYMKRVLQSAWGLPVDEKIPLREYFENRPLPSANWKGWNENVPIDDIKVKFVDQVGLDPSEFDIWEDDEARAKALDVQTPDVFNGRENAHSYSRKLTEILKGYNVKGLSVDIIESENRGIQVNMDIQQNRQDDVKRLINNEGHYVV